MITEPLQKLIILNFMPERIPSIIKKLRKLGQILDGQQEKIKKDITHEKDHIVFLKSNLKRLISANTQLRKARHDTITQRHASSICSKSRSESRNSRKTFFRSPSALKNKLTNNDNLHPKLEQRSVVEVTNFSTFRGRVTTGALSSRVMNGEGKENRLSTQVVNDLKNAIKGRRTLSRKSYHQHYTGYSRIGTK